jgi:hypothetical protein
MSPLEMAFKMVDFLILMAVEKILAVPLWNILVNIT